MQDDSVHDDNSETGPNYSSDVCEFWGGVLDRCINHIGNAPPVQQYSTATISNIEALAEEKRVLQDAIDNIHRRCDNEDRALDAVRDALHEHREREEYVIKSAIATIHHHHNALIPIARLPPEILSRIFVSYAQLESQKWLGAALISTHVCRRWRQIGLGCSGLWSHIDCRSAAWMAAMMERSRLVPLSLVVVNQEYMSPRKIALISDNLHRFKSLDLHIPDISRNLFLEIFSRSLPLLEDLSVAYFGYTSRFAFPPKFLDRYTPNLRHIRVSTHAYIPWTSGLFTNLVTLHINKHMKGERNDLGEPPLEMLLSALTNMPGLETLILRGCLPPPTLSTTIAHVDLPNLGSLWTSGPLRNSTCLFRQITLNADVAMIVHITCFYVSTEDIDEFFAVFPSRLCTAPSSTAQALKFNWHDRGGFKTDVWTVQQATEVKNDDNSKIALTFDWDSGDSRGVSPLDLTWACFAAFASPQLHSFRVTGIIEWDVEVWRQLAHVSPDLRRLAPGSVARCVELCMALRPPDGQELVPTDCCLPVLSYLELLSPPNHLVWMDK